MNILLTGSSGFLGQVIHQSFISKATVLTLNRSSADIKIDLSNNVPEIVTNCQIVIHAAGKAHSIPKTTIEKQAFFDINVEGTKNLLKGLELAPQLPQYFVFISSVAVYGIEAGHLITEDTPLLAEDPYGKSKIEAEQIVQEWCAKNSVVCTILRLPLLAGATPPGNLGAMIKGIKKGYYFNIGGGKAQKSVVLAEDVAKMIPLSAKIGGVYNLTDRYHPNFNELSIHIAKQLNKAKPVSIPLFIAKLIALVGDLIGNKAPINSKKLNKIISDLTFDDSKAVEILNWKPSPVLENLKIRL